ncbi:hypothetical protein QYM36_014672 [Artemia franciscana]|uniref:Reverse transcriptase domain-containing protein n=1 Tax=Artemia franciscana TaxID=6661 RepID=A0AA88KYM4_ARTSF|nr:hypothetical protein QYM36_014672 [Artemia franciscana]
MPPLSPTHTPSLKASLILFNYTRDQIMKNALKEDDVAFSAQKITDIEYANDGTVLADSAQKAQSMIERVAKTASETGLAISILKTKYLSTKENTSIYISGEPIEMVEEFKYPRSSIDAKGGATSEIQGRISKAWFGFGQLRKPLWIRREIKLVKKLRI